MIKKIVILLVVLVVWFVNTGGMVLSGTKRSNLQSDVPLVVLVGTLDMGIQTGSTSNDSYLLSVGFFNPTQVTVLPADFNADGVVNFSDFLLFASGFGRQPSDPKYNIHFDLDRDGKIGFSDFLLFAAAFTG